MRHLLGLVALFVLLSASPASASGFYVGTYGGWNQDDVISAPFLNSKGGYVAGAVIGTRLPSVPGVRIEADLSLRSNETDLFGGFISADHDTTAVMGNVIWDLPLNIGPVRPYALAGVGVAQTQATFENVALLRLEATGVAYQLGAGLQTDIADGVTAGIGYRYFAGPELEVLGLQLSDGTNHSVVASVNFAF